MEIIRGKYVEQIDYQLSFDDGYGNGFGFPCDANGNILDSLSDAAKKNYEWCMEHPENFERFNKVVSYKHKWKELDYGICKCGETVYMQNEYLGACHCPKCGQWYNLFGQELLPPEKWSEGDDW